MTRRAVASLLLLMAAAFLVVGQLYVTIPLGTVIAAAYGVAPGEAALTGSAFGFAYAAGFLVFGPLSDHYGRRIVLLGGLLALAVTTLLVALAPSFPWLLAARALQGLAASSFPPVALSLVAESLPPERRTLGVSLMSFAFLGAAPLAQFLGAASGAELSTLMLELAPLYLVIAFGLAMAMRGEARGGGAVASAGGRAREILRDPGLLCAWGAALTVLFGFVSFHAGALALHGATSAVDLQALRLAGLPPLLLTLAAAPIARRFDPAATAGMGLGLAALALAVAVLLPPSLLVGPSALLSAGVALAVPGLIATVAGRVPTSARGLALAVYSFALFLGASLAPPFSESFAALGSAPLWLVPSALLLIGAWGMVASRPAPKRVLARLVLPREP